MSGLRDPIGEWLRRHDAPRWLAIALATALLLAALIGLHLAWQRIAVAWENDAFGFWGAWQDGDLYDVPWLTVHAYVYAPVLAQLWWPLTFLSWPDFSTVWNGAQLAALVAVAGPIWAAALIWLLPGPASAAYPNPIVGVLENGNPVLLLALIVAVGYRWPAVWSLAILMKVTPVIGLAWFAARGEWRRLALAAGATLLLAGISFVAAPSLWFEWFGLLAAAAGASTAGHELIWLPLVVRLPLSLALVVWGARTDRYWTVPLGVMLALPAIQLGGFALAVAALPFTRLPWVPLVWSGGRSERSAAFS